MAGNEDIDTPPKQDISNVFAAADFSSQSSYDTVKYKRAWYRAEGIRSSILYSGKSPDAQTHLIYPVMVEYLYLHYQPSLSLYWLLPMYLVVDYSVSSVSIK